MSDNPLPTPEEPCSVPSPSRRATLRTLLLAAAGAIVPALALDTEEAAARRRHFCAIRCGGDRRLCRAECRIKGVIPKQCKRTCDIIRDHCAGRCDYLPLRRRTQNRWPRRPTSVR